MPYGGKYQPVIEGMMTLDEVAVFFGVQRDTVNRWDRCGILPHAYKTPGGWRRWKRSDVEAIAPKERSKAVPWKLKMRQVSEETAIEFTRRRKAGESVRALAREYGFSEPTIRKYIRRLQAADSTESEGCGIKEAQGQAG
jgi:transposase-like protein